MIDQVKTDTSRILHILEKTRVEDKKKVPYDDELLRAARSVDALKPASGMYPVTDKSKLLFGLRERKKTQKLVMQ